MRTGSQQQDFETQSFGLKHQPDLVAKNVDESTELDMVAQTDEPVRWACMIVKTVFTSTS